MDSSVGLKQQGSRLRLGLSNLVGRSREMIEQTTPASPRDRLQSESGLGRKQGKKMRTFFRKANFDFEIDL
jgi:hypothetical protein